MKESTYWIDNYGTNKSKDFIDGVIAGVTIFAIWKNGKQYVGLNQVPLETEVAEIKKQLGNFHIQELYRKESGGESNGT